MKFDITHDRLIELGFKLNYPESSQSFYSVKIDSSTQLYYSKNTISLFKKGTGNIHQFHNITSLSDIVTILELFIRHR